MLQLFKTTRVRIKFWQHDFIKIYYKLLLRNKLLFDFDFIKSCSYKYVRRVPFDVKRIFAKIFAISSRTNKRNFCLVQWRHSGKVSEPFNWLAEQVRMLFKFKKTVTTRYVNHTFILITT